MRKVKLIVHETYQGKSKSEDVFAVMFPQTAQSDLFVAATNAKRTAYTYRDISASVRVLWLMEVASNTFLGCL